MSWKNTTIQLAIAFILGLTVLLLPRPEGTRFEIIGDPQAKVLASMEGLFDLAPNGGKTKKGYLVDALKPDDPACTAQALADKAEELGLTDVKVEYVNGLSPKGKTFLAVVVFLVFLFIFEPIPLEVTAICIGVLLVATGVGDLKSTWAAYMHPVVVFIMCCLIFAIALEKAGITKRLSASIARRAGNSVTKFTFILAVGLGLASAFMHDAAAAAIGIATMLPLMRAAGINPGTNTARFMMLSVPFACSCGGMGSLVGGGRTMVAAAFLKEFTGIEIDFIDWLIYAMPLSIICVPAAVLVVYLVFRPDPKFKLPEYDEDPGPLTPLEKKTLIIVGIGFLLWLTKGFHGLHYSITGMLCVAGLVLFNVLNWEDIHRDLEWGTVLFIFGGGIAMGLAMDSSGAARYFANLFFPLVQGGGWIILLSGVCVFGALVTNVMANVAAAAMILPIVLPLAQLEGVDPRIMALGLGTATSFAMLLVIGCPPNAIAYSFRQFKAFDLTKAGLVATPVLLVLLLAGAGIWWSILGLV
ncbi:SLC13 family permease [Dethiosulfatarculus sandiegensis]|uniref:Anion transporter n=1 Tax=Dethiosulfatarculus sandiegensis TaxID=1429043 RepID=A0A0D2JJE2_9BACT|nr:DASS family sodium-coupled anion symporter [Dethiosulfatarculus sandiegensis]KIX15796.1 anion transporter [Dethiosulfatarculus sandiegensis]